MSSRKKRNRRRPTGSAPLKPKEQHEPTPPQTGRWIAGAVVVVVAVAALVVARWPGNAQPAATPDVPDVAPVTLESKELPVVPGLAEVGRSVAEREKWSKADPAADNWQTEVFNTEVGKQLKKLGKLLSHPEEIDESKLGDWASPEFRTAGLRPSQLTVCFDQAPVTVRRGEIESAFADAPYEGFSGLAAALKELAEPFHSDHHVHTKFKTVRVTPGDLEFETTDYYLAAGHPDSGAVQQNATWHCRWVRTAEGDPPLLAGVRVEEYEEVTGPPGGESLYADWTASVLGRNESYVEQLVHSLDHWRASLDGTLGLRFTGHEGIAVGDVNGDGLDDLYVCQPGGLPNRLYVQNADGTATDASTESGVDVLDLTSSAVFVDFDNDGDQDLALATYGDVHTLLNDGSGRFERAGSTPVPFAHALSAADYDLDGLVDVYVCCYVDPDRKDSTPVPYHDANTGRRNVMLHNEGGGQFRDVTEEVGLEANNRRFTFAASWEDYDDDGDPDLYVANDYGRNNLYRNDGGVFVDAAAEAGVEDLSAGMSVTWADHDRDGDMDLYVSNMFSSAGNRITYQRQFKPESDDSVRSQYQRHARGNSLFENLGDGTFADISEPAGVTMGRWAWSSNFIDFNNDGWEDVFVANGFVTNEDTKDL